MVRPDGPFELLAAIEVLKYEVNRRPAVVVVDGMGSFFWQDKVMRYHVMWCDRTYTRCRGFRARGVALVMVLVVAMSPRKQQN